ncbi:hypothetical protein F2Q69_00050899 [Brassica cretica]|uniref:Protein DETOXIFICATION n=1 Tax=Brassica cretica TaxID=69181 RepID=A0A8S9PGN3_BRACR|nr:hypothetical protein F2Q69_00050899 [Brassica cretica]
MENGFSLAEREEEEDNKNEKSSGMMMKKVSYMAAPMVAVYLSQYLLQVISMVMAGHLDELSLSSVAIATSLTNVTGFSLLVGFSGALETLCGQAFGAEQYRKIGSYTYSSMICLVLICFPISLLWVYMDKLLELFHQDPLISDGDNQPGKSWVRSRWEVVALEGPSGPIRTRLQTRGHWWDLHGVITSPPGGLGGLPGLAPVDGLWSLVGSSRGLGYQGYQKKTLFDCCAHANDSLQ